MGLGKEGLWGCIGNVASSGKVAERGEVLQTKGVGRIGGSAASIRQKGGEGRGL